MTVVALFWPETKGIGLEHMDRLFGEVDPVEVFEEKEAHGQQTQENSQMSPQTKQIS
jgi:hypothetical protein